MRRVAILALMPAAAAGCGGAPPADRTDPTAVRAASSAGSAVQADSAAKPAVTRTAPGKPVVPLAIEPRSPRRTLTYRDNTKRFRVTFPADWQIASRRALARINLVAGNLTAVATFPIRPRPQDACGDGVDEPRVDVGDSDALVLVGHDLHSRADLARKRPRPFRLFEQVAANDPEKPRQRLLFPWPCRNQVGVSGLVTTFGDSGRVFTVTAMVGKDASVDTQRETLAVLNSMEFFER